MLRKLKLFITSGDHFTGHQLARYIVSTEGHERFESITVGGTDRSRMEDLERQGIKVVEYNVQDKNKLQQCLKGMDVVYVIPPHRTEREDSGRNLIEACKAAGVHCVLLWSIVGVDQAKEQWMKHMHELERCLKQSGIKSHCIIRVNMYMENFLFYAHHAQRNGELPLPIGQGKFPPISIRDVNHFTTVLLSGKHRKDDDKGDYNSDMAPPVWEEDREQPTGPFVLSNEHHGKIYCLTGCEAVSGEELVRKASEAIGAQLKFKDIQPNEAERILRDQGELEQNEIKLLLEMYIMVKEGRWHEISKDFKKVTGKKPIHLVDFFQDHAHEFKPSK